MGATRVQFFIHEMYLIQNRPSFKTILKLLEAANSENLHECMALQLWMWINDWLELIPKMTKWWIIVNIWSLCLVAMNIMYEKGHDIHKYLCQHIGIYSASVYGLTK